MLVPSTRLAAGSITGYGLLKRRSTVRARFPNYAFYALYAFYGYLENMHYAFYQHRVRSRRSRRSRPSGGLRILWDARLTSAR